MGQSTISTGPFSSSRTVSQSLPEGTSWVSGWWFGTWLLCSISYMGCHPSHWLSLHHFSRWWNCTTKQLSMHHMWIYATTLIQDVSKDTAALAKIPTCNLKMTRWHHHLPGLVNIQKTMEKSDFLWVNQLFLWAIFNSYVKLPEGKSNMEPKKADPM